jgi:transketolase
MRDTSDLGNMKDAVMAAIIDLAEEHKDVVMLEADLMTCLGSTGFKKKFPERFYNCGIAEANMVGVAAGLSSMGFVPFADSFGVFSSRRVYDQFFLSVNYAKQRVHLIGTDPGVVAQVNGGTHMPFEDIALMRQIPDLIIIDPSDGQSCYELIRQAYESGHSSYIRVGRRGITHRYPVGTKIELGKGIVLTEGDDVAIIAEGETLVNEAVKAVEILKEKGIKATLVDMHTIKPLDTELIEKLAKKTGRILVCENGRYAGGLGEAVAGHLAKVNPTKMDFVSVGEKFGEVGNLSYLIKAFNFSAEDIAAKAEALVK